MSIFTLIIIAEYFQEMLQNKNGRIYMEIPLNNLAKHFSKSLNIEFTIDIFFFIRFFLIY
jgi:hypothetical protein